MPPVRGGEGQQAVRVGVAVLQIAMPPVRGGEGQQAARVGVAVLQSGMPPARAGGIAVSEHEPSPGNRRDGRTFA
jgi:hypothetical protein